MTTEETVESKIGELDKNVNGVSKESCLNASHSMQCDTKDTPSLYQHVCSCLYIVDGTEISVHNCASILQEEYGDEPHLRKKCLDALVCFFLTVDNESQCNTFYVLNDLVQYDCRFRAESLEIVIPRIAYAVAEHSNLNLFTKTVNVWRDRSIFPPTICDLILEAFTSTQLHFENVAEFEKRLEVLSEIVTRRSLQDEEMRRSLDDNHKDQGASNNMNETTKATTAILSASNSELECMRAASQTALKMTEETISYISRLLTDFDEMYSRSNALHMRQLFGVAHSTANTT